MFLLGPRSVTSLQLIQVVLVLDIKYICWKCKIRKLTINRRFIAINIQLISQICEKGHHQHEVQYIQYATLLQDSHPRTRYAFGEWQYPAPHVARARRQPAPRSTVAKSAKFPWGNFYPWQHPWILWQPMWVPSLLKMDQHVSKLDDFSNRKDMTPNDLETNAHVFVSYAGD